MTNFFKMQELSSKCHEHFFVSRTGAGFFLFFGFSRFSIFWGYFCFPVSFNFRPSELGCVVWSTAVLHVEQVCIVLSDGAHTCLTLRGNHVYASLQGKHKLVYFRSYASAGVDTLSIINFSLLSFHQLMINFLLHPLPKVRIYFFIHFFSIWIDNVHGNKIVLIDLLVVTPRWLCILGPSPSSRDAFSCWVLHDMLEFLHWCEKCLDFSSQSYQK